MSALLSFFFFGREKLIADVVIGLDDRRGTEAIGSGSWRSVSHQSLIAHRCALCIFFLYNIKLTRARALRKVVPAKNCAFIHMPTPEDAKKVRRRDPMLVLWLIEREKKNVFLFRFSKRFRFDQKPGTKSILTQ